MERKGLTDQRERINIYIYVCVCIFNRRERGGWGLFTSLRSGKKLKGVNIFNLSLGMARLVEVRITDRSDHNYIMED